MAVLDRKSSSRQVSEQDFLLVFLCRFVVCVDRILLFSLILPLIMTLFIRVEKSWKTRKHILSPFPEGRRSKKTRASCQHH